jgi:hypothetical protein
MFQFPPFASQLYGFKLGYPGFTRMGFPIQESPGLSLLGSSPKLIVAHHAFLRLLVPRHPPYALSSLTTNTYSICDENRLQIRLSKSFSMNAGMEPRSLWTPCQLSWWR